jgi:hypothetical protein
MHQVIFFGRIYIPIIQSLIFSRFYHRIYINKIKIAWQHYVPMNISYLNMVYCLSKVITWHYIYYAIFELGYPIYNALSIVTYFQCSEAFFSVSNLLQHLILVEEKVGI